MDFQLQALCGVRVDVPTLSGGDRLVLSLTDEVIKPTTVKRIVGKGLPQVLTHFFSNRQMIRKDYSNLPIYVALLDLADCRENSLNRSDSVLCIVVN